MNGKSKRMVVGIVLAVLILAVSVIPVVAGFDTGGGSNFRDPELERRFPAGMLRAEGWQ